MWSTLILILIGVSAGCTVAVAELALVNAIGVYSRMAAKSRTGNFLVFYENVVGAGLIAGSVFSVFHLQTKGLFWLIPLVGFFVGCFVGNLIMGLAEVIDVFPILFRRVKVKEGLAIFVIMVALGKLLGSFAYFILAPWKLQ